ncbi:hypothetical protein AB0M95_13040 [Sphaerisporangium sp. NPDC051017]|uniref:hypothetical protein n=1 Tax=Sphaerisporangium sp. NPDC051017 TaxID=3154636 RepID=UPI003426567F
MNDLKRFRAQCEKLLRELTIPNPFEITTFCDSVSERRGKPMILTPAQMTPTAESCPYGLWVGFDHVDRIYYEQDTSPLHRDAIILHEVSHMLLGHSSDVADALSLSGILPDLDPGKVRHWLSRRIYTTDNELQAELLSSLILERASVSPPHSGSWVTRLSNAWQRPSQTPRD